MNEGKKAIFSKTYSAVHQKKFLEQLYLGKVGEALQALESMPSPITHREKIDYLFVMNEGRGIVIYSLTKGYVRNNCKVLPEKRAEGLVEKLKELRRYRDLGPIDELEEDVKNICEAGGIDRVLKAERELRVLETSIDEAIRS